MQVAVTFCGIAPCSSDLVSFDSSSFEARRASLRSGAGAERHTGPRATPDALSRPWCGTAYMPFDVLPAQDPAGVCSQDLALLFHSDLIAAVDVEDGLRVGAELARSAPIRPEHEPISPEP